MPFAARLLQCLITLHGAFPAGTSYCKLHSEHRKSHCHEEDEIEQYKQTAAVLTCDIRETPDVSDADGTAGTD